MITASAILTQALQIAKCPGYISQATVALNAILEELALLHDFDTQRALAVINVPGDAVDTTGMVYSLPTDYLRADSLFYNVNGAIYHPTPVTLDEYDRLNKTPTSSYPNTYTTDLGKSQLLIYPMPSISIQLNLRYFGISSLSNTAVIPWFKYQKYLIHAVATEMMKITNDPRWASFEKIGEAMLDSFSKLTNDLEGKLNRVQKDERFFRSGRFSKSTKYVL